MIGSSVNLPTCGVNRLFYLKVRCKITVAVFSTLRQYLSAVFEGLVVNTKYKLTSTSHGIPSI
jgi:hypothetical protein